MFCEGETSDTLRLDRTGGAGRGRGPQPPTPHGPTTEVMPTLPDSTIRRDTLSTKLPAISSPHNRVGSILLHVRQHVTLDLTSPSVPYLRQSLLEVGPIGGGFLYRGRAVVKHVRQKVQPRDFYCHDRRQGGRQQDTTRRGNTRQ